MAYCEHAQKIEQESQGSWKALVLRSHVARCVLCQAILQVDADGNLSESVARKLGANVVVKPKNGWIGSVERKVAIIKNQELNISE